MMERDRNFDYELEFQKYYQLNNLPKNIFLLEAECLDIPAEATTNTPLHSPKSGITFALGFIATLLVFSGFQLHSSLRVTPANPKITQPRKSLTFVPKNKLTELPSYEKIGLSNREIEILWLKNALSKGKF